MVVKMNLRVITKNHAADLEIGFLTKSIPKPYGRPTAMPPAWELNFKFFDGKSLSKALCDKKFTNFQKFCPARIFENRAVLR